MKFETKNGNGIVIRKRTLVDIPRNHSLLIEAPVRIGGDIIQVEHIGAFSILPTSGLFRCIDYIGRFTIIAPNVQIGNPQHCPEAISPNPIFGNFDAQWCEGFHTLLDSEEWNLEQKKNIVKRMGKRMGNTYIGNDVWIGYGAIVMRGLKIGNGAIIGAGAVVTRDVEPYTIVGGVPAKVIKKRFSFEDIKKLEELKWWEYGPDILKGVDLLDIDCCIETIQKRIDSGIDKYLCDKFLFDKDKCYLIDKLGDKKEYSF